MEKDTVQLTIDLMKETFGSTFKTYYDGDPEVIPLFNLPAIIVTQANDTTTEGEMGEDDISDEITVKVVLDKRDDYSNELDPLNGTERRIREFIALIDPDTKTYAVTTVKGALRSKLLEGVTAIAPTMTVNYGINPRITTGDSDAGLTAEGHVTFSVQYSVDTY